MIEDDLREYRILWSFVILYAVHDLHTKHRKSAQWFFTSPKESGLEDICWATGYNLRTLLDKVQPYIKGEKVFNFRHFAENGRSAKQIVCPKSHRRAEQIVVKHFRENRIDSTKKLMEMQRNQRKLLSKIRTDIVNEVYYSGGHIVTEGFRPISYEELGEMIGLKRNSVVSIVSKIRMG